MNIWTCNQENKGHYTVLIPTIPKQASTWSGGYKDLTATPPLVTHFPILTVIKFNKEMYGSEEKGEATFQGFPEGCSSFKTSFHLAYFMQYAW